MAKKVKGITKLQIEAGKANPAPPIGPALAGYGINIMAFCKEYNARTSSRPGEVIPAEITVYSDGSFTFVLKTSPTAVLLRKAAKIDANKNYPMAEAITLARSTSYAKFNATMEVHMHLGVDPKHADQNVRDVVVLPHGLGKVVRVLVFADGEGGRLAQEAGADVIADDETIKRIQEGWAEFDVAVATPDMMGKGGRLGRVLGPRGLWPNPKTGTVVPAADLPRAIRQA